MTAPSQAELGRPQSLRRPFDFERDTFSFPNELVWEYRFKEGGTETVMTRNDPPPTYAHHCFVVARTAKQFHAHVHFAPELPEASESEYRELIRKVRHRSPRKTSLDSKRIVFPGYASLRSFSKARERLLKAECGGAWQSYFVRSHWRMVLPFTRGDQARTARRIAAELPRRLTTVVHIFTFPQLTINHAVLLYGSQESAGEIRFQTYDPNVPARPVELIFKREDSAFHFPRNHYWAGGKLRVVETYRNWLF